MVSFGHCVVSSSSIYEFWLPLWYLLAIVSFFFFDIQILITALVSFDHCFVCPSSIYRFWLPLWYLLAIVSSVLLRYRDSDYPLVCFGHCVVSSSSIYEFCLPLWYHLAIVSFFFFDIQILITALVSFDHCFVCSSSIYRFWLPFGIIWPLCRLLFFDIQILITPLVSCGHCVVSSYSLYGFWLPLWYLLAIVLSVLLLYTDSDYPFGIFWPSCCQFFFDILILITPLVSFGHCVVSSSSIYGFRLHLWYLLAIVSSALLWFTDSDYPFGIFWPLCCQFFFDIQILITPLVSFGHCVVSSSSIYRFWLPIWYLFAIVLSVLFGYRDSDLPLLYLLAIVLSVLLRYTNSDYPIGILWALCPLLFFDIWILITSLVSFGYCVVSFSLIYRFWLPLWYLLTIVSSALLRYTNSDYPFGIFWPLCRLLFFDIQILIIPLVSFDHCVVCPSLIYRFWLPLWYILTIVLSVLLRYTDSDYPFGICWPLCCQFFFDIRILITPLVSFGHCVVSSSIYRFWLPIWYLFAIVLSVLFGYRDSDLPLWYILAIVLSVLLRYTNSDYPIGILWALCPLLFFDIWILITSLVSFGYCVVSFSLIYRFWLPLWYLLTIVSSALLRYTNSDYPFGIFWPLCRLLFFDIQILITPLVSFDHCFVCSSSIYKFWLPFWYLLAIVLSVLLRYTDYDYPFGIFWPLCCQFLFDIGIRITPLVSVGHCVVSSSSIYGFRLHLWYLLAIVSSALLWYTDSDYPFGTFWPLCRLLFFDIQILITPLVYFEHCVVSSSSIYGFWLPLWYLLAIMLSVLLRYTDSDYPFGIVWPLCCQFFFDIRILITPLVSFGHCVVYFSSIYRLWLPLWYLVAIVSSVLLRYTDSDYPLVSCGHCVVCSSSIYRFWLPIWYLVAIVSSALLRSTDFDYPFGILWPLCRLLIFDIQIVITPLVYFGHCVVCSSSIYRFWLSLWYLVAIVSSALLRYTDSDYPFGIFWPLCCQFFFDILILMIPLVSFGHCVVISSSIYRFWLSL